jgi:hypothetical protein
LNTDFAQWAAHFAPSACAFQIGYPADEDGMDGKNTGGWWRLQDPIKDWGQALLAKINNPQQELGLLWVCAKSGKSYNAKWDLTMGATVPARRAAVEHRVSDAAAIARAASQAQPGDVLVMSDGAWRDQAIVFDAKGTAERPITLRAQTPGKVVLTGKSSITIDGEHLVRTRGVPPARHGHGRWRETGRSQQPTDRECRGGGSYKFFVHLFGTSNRFDHCYLAGKTNDDPTLQIEVQGKHNFHILDHNHFGHRPPLGRNGGETIRVGYSHQSMTNSGTLVEQNLFERCDGELEIISSKSCEKSIAQTRFLIAPECSPCATAIAASWMGTSSSAITRTVRAAFASSGRITSSLTTTSTVWRREDSGSRQAFPTPNSRATSNRATVSSPLTPSSIRAGQRWNWMRASATPAARCARRTSRLRTTFSQ